MNTYDIIPDIHGQAAKLDAALATLGWQRRGLGWHHTDPNRQIVFLGDFIDGGPDNRAVLHTVRSLMDAGKAQAVMGNHELNAVHFHTTHPNTGQPLRAHSAKNIRQHQSFLDQFPLGDPQTRDAVDWMRRLPLFLQTASFRAVHACWVDASIDRLRALTREGVLTDAQVILTADAQHADEVYFLVEQATCGPEHRLPEGWSFKDKNEAVRHLVRLKWWQTGARNWRDSALSVPMVDELPDAELPAMLTSQTYSADAAPVFFGHYCLKGQPVLQGQNVLCLDCAAGNDGPLVTYEMRPDEPVLRADRIWTHR